MRSRKNKGFTLIELLVSLGISSLLLLCASALAISYTSLFRNGLKDSKTLFIIGNIQEVFYQKTDSINDRIYLDDNSVYFMHDGASEAQLLFSDVSTISMMTDTVSEDKRNLMLSITYQLSGKDKSIEMIRIFGS